MKVKKIKKRILYDGSQLRSLYAYQNYGIMGDSILIWRGPCDVSPEFMVDGEDKREDALIAGHDMIHLIIEKFGEGLGFAVAMQRLIAAVVKDEVEALVRVKSINRKKLFRDGDDIYYGNKKFSISIATVSPVSALIHFAINVTNEGTPVKTCALSDFAINPDIFAERVLKRVQAEMLSLFKATTKVFWVK